MPLLQQRSRKRLPQKSAAASNQYVHGYTTADSSL
jgi:hypothetical protein